MKEETLLHKIFMKIFRKAKLIESKEVNKAEMCEKAVKANVCPHACEICAWNENR